MDDDKIPEAIPQERAMLIEPDQSSAADSSAKRARVDSGPSIVTLVSVQRGLDHLRLTVWHFLEFSPELPEGHREFQFS